MNKEIITNEEFCYKNKSPLVNIYFNGLLNLAINLSGCWKNKNVPVILDFGCSSQQLKKILIKRKIEFNYVGYDIDSKYSDIDDYTKLHPDYIFCINVLEHLSINELREVLHNFKKMNKDVRIISAVPGKNFLSDFLNKNVSDKINWEHKSYQVHKSTFMQVLKILNDNCRLLRSKDYMLIQKVQLWNFV